MGWGAIRRIGGGAQAATHKSSPPMAKGHLGSHLRTARQGTRGQRRLNPLNRAGRTWRPCSEMGPQTLRVGGDARRRGRPPYPVISNHKSFQSGLRSVIRLILFFRR